MKDIKVYVVDTYNYKFDESPLTWTDEVFISEAKIQGSVFTLKEFEGAINRCELDFLFSFVRFL